MERGHKKKIRMEYHQLEGDTPFLTLPCRISAVLYEIIYLTGL